MSCRFLDCLSLHVPFFFFLCRGVLCTTSSILSHVLSVLLSAFALEGVGADPSFVFLWWGWPLKGTLTAWEVCWPLASAEGSCCLLTKAYALICVY
uniref:Putative secreted protein n=1 Tax=Amblyomma triste TaxID=251400 RepID=A0A023G3V4_AMBTT